MVSHTSFNSTLFQRVVQSRRASPTELAYEGTPLAHSSGKFRGQNLKEIAFRTTLFYTCRSRLFGFDWFSQTARVKFYSSQLSYVKDSRSWSCTFRAVKLRQPGHQRDDDCFDELHLGIYTPLGLFVYLHDMHLGVSTVGVRTSELGYFYICLRASQSCSTWKAALDDILRKLDDEANTCKRLAVVEWKNR